MKSEAFFRYRIRSLELEYENQIHTDVGYGRLSERFDWVCVLHPARLRTTTLCRGHIRIRVLRATARCHPLSIRARNLLLARRQGHETLLSSTLNRQRLPRSTDSAKPLLSGGGYFFINRFVAQC